MQVKYKTPDNAYEFTFDADTAKQAFEINADLCELFPLEACGSCSSGNVKPVVRTAKGFQFYELYCNDCRCRLRYGQVRDTKKLFPRRKDESGNWLESRGWTKWSPNQDSEGSGTGVDW